LNKGRNPASVLSLDSSRQESASSRKPASNDSASLDTSANSQPSSFNIPMIMATIMVFIQLGRPFDQFLTGYHLPAIIGSIGIIVTFFTPWAAAMRTKTGVALMLFVGIMCVASVFSIWRGGSVTFVQYYVELNVVTFCLLGAAPATAGQIRWLALVGLGGCLFNVAVGSAFDSMGRLYLSDAMYGNSDDVALISGLCIPLVLLLASRLGKVFGAIVGVAGVIGCLALVGLSAARFSLISLTVMAFVYFFRAGGGQRIALILCFGVLVVGSVFLLPKNTVERLSTITSIWNSNTDESAGITTAEAVASMNERKQLSEDALQAFLTHPVLGVGPAVFIDWRWDNLHRRGQPAHNTYLQTAAENGIFGVIFYASFLVMIFLALRKCTKELKGWEDGRQVALALQQCLIFFIVSASFLNCLSHSHQFVFAGLAVALDRLRQQQAETVNEPETASGADSVAIPSARRPNPLRPLPARNRTEESQPSEPVRPARYRFNRPVVSSRRD